MKHRRGRSSSELELIELKKKENSGVGGGFVSSSHIGETAKRKKEEVSGNRRFSTHEGDEEEARKAGDAAEEVIIKEGSPFRDTSRTEETPDGSGWSSDSDSETD